MRIALAQINPVVGDLKANKNKIIDIQKFTIFYYNMIINKKHLKF